MCDDRIITQLVVDSPVMEQVNAAFEAISELGDLFLRSSSTADLSDFHGQLKQLMTKVMDSYGQPKFGQIEKDLAAQPEPPFVPFSVSSFHQLPDADISDFPGVKPNFPPRTRGLTITDKAVDLLQYPVMTSVAFSLVDEPEQLSALIEAIRTHSEIGLAIFCHPEPLVLSAISISLRECEYLIDVAEIPTAIEDLAPVFADRRITKVVHNSAHVCRLLHMFGVGELESVFCITTAALYLDMPTSLAELTSEFRHLLHEGWISDGVVKVSERRTAESASDDRMSKMVSEISGHTVHDWRLRPISLEQMKLARQDMHYLLYLYDLLRCSLNRADKDLLRYTLQVSHQKSYMRWDHYRFVLRCPNEMILASLYQQPIPNRQLFRNLMAVKRHNPDEISYAEVLWVALIAPANQDELEQALLVCDPCQHDVFKKPHVCMSDPVQNLVLTVVAKSHYTPSDKKKLAHKEPKTLEEIIEELGWVVTDMDSESAGSQSTDCLLEATIPPRFMSKTERVADSQSASGGYLKHLRNPDQPTSVSRQIEGIPRTESRIYALANNVRMMQKINGKPKAKLPAGKDEQIPETPPAEVSRRLLHIGYIDAEDMKRFSEKPAAPKTEHRRARSAQNSKTHTRRSPTSQALGKR